MKKWKPLNMELRCLIIKYTLRLEQISSDVLKIMFRIFKHDTKTLGNKSSALSFKSKIDLLYDFEELTKDEYNHLLKIMEIRNQFAHNSAATSFKELDNINKDINKYLKKFPPKEITSEMDEEEILLLTFLELFKMTAGKLSILEIEYKKGIKKEMRQVINNEIIQNIDIIWEKAFEKKKNSTLEFQPYNLFMMNQPESIIEDFQLQFKIEINEFFTQKLDELTNVEIFRKKEEFNLTKLKNRNSPSDSR